MVLLSIILKKPYNLVICEKPSAAQRIAQALGTFDLKKTTLPIVDTKNNMSTSSSFFLQQIIKDDILLSVLH